MSKGQIDLSDKVAVVVGAGSSGDENSIGRETALLFAMGGAKVAAIDVSIEEAQKTALIINENGGQAIAIEADAANNSSVEMAIESVVRKFNQIDILHNNVGIMSFGVLENISTEDWDKVIGVNIRSVFLAAKHAVPYLKERGSGTIINMSSIAAIRSTGANYHAYTASKAAILGLTQSLAVEYAPFGVRVNCVIPGFVDSAMMLGGLRQRLPESEINDFILKRSSKIPLLRFALPVDIANCCLFLASDLAAYITGTSIVIDGGVSLTMKS